MSFWRDRHGIAFLNYRILFYLSRCMLTYIITTYSSENPIIWNSLLIPYKKLTISHNNIQAIIYTIILCVYLYIFVYNSPWDKWASLIIFSIFAHHQKSRWRKSTQIPYPKCISLYQKHSHTNFPFCTTIPSQEKTSVPLFQCG